MNFGLAGRSRPLSARASNPLAVSLGDTAFLALSGAEAFRGESRPLSAVTLGYRAACPAPFNGGSGPPVWKRMPECLAQNLRDTDLKHVSGQEITVLLPNTGVDGAAVVGQRLCDIVRAQVGGRPPAAPGEGLVVRQWPVVEAATPPPGCSPSTSPAVTGGAGDRCVDRGVAAPVLRDAPALRRYRSPGPALAKRAIDLVGAALGTVLALPLMGLIAAAIKLTSPGPVLFRQRRVGYGGRAFSMLKFRTMRVDGGEDLHREYIRRLIENGHGENRGTESRPVYKLTDDPRVTPLGAFLRRWSLDELPQLWNVMVGHMSLVGPRPSVHYELESYRPWHFHRLEVKPGLTGLWQVHGRARTTFDDMVRMDVRYVKRWSLRLDLKLIAGTFGAVLRRQGGL